MSAAGLSKLSRLHKLATLELRMQVSLEDAEMEALPAMPRLRHVTLTHCADLGDGILRWLARCPRLRTLRLWNCGSFSIPTLVDLVSTGGLRVLDVGWNCGPTAAELAGLGKLMPQVQVVVRKSTPFFARMAISVNEAAEATPMPHERFAFNELMWRKSFAE